MGVLSGLLAGLGIDGTARPFVEGFRSMAFAATLIGFARAIFVVLDKGKSVDTVINGVATPLMELPAVVFTLGMTVVQAAIFIVIPSTSGRAVLTMPILGPMSDLLGVSRQMTVLAYQGGAGVINHILPTDGTLMAILVVAGAALIAGFASRRRVRGAVRAGPVRDYRGRNDGAAVAATDLQPADQETRKNGGTRVSRSSFL